MAKPKPASATISSSLLLLFILHTTANTETQSTDIIHVSQSTSSAILLRSLPNHLTVPSPRLIYNYTLATHGFSAILTPSQASHLRTDPTILSVRQDETRYLHTTYTPSFLHLSNTTGLWLTSDFASDVVIGILDSGIYPHSHASFADTGLPPIPNSWKGSCPPSFPFKRKLIGGPLSGRIRSPPKSRPSRAEARTTKI